jgi:hypothetical protein
MGFIEDIAKLSEQVRKKADNVVGEDATKLSLILPFFNALGYDIWDPAEVLPEYISDAATKKSSGHFEKVDYAIGINGTIVMLVEAKARNQKPETHDGQLRKYFTWTISSKVGIVTNGVEYRFFTDLRIPNIMDDEPFFSFNVFEYDSKDIENLKFFHRDNFDIAAIGKHAEEMVYVKAMTKLVGNLLRSPSEPFIKFLVKELEVFQGHVNAKVISRFEPVVKKAIQSSLVDLMTRSINQEIAQLTEPIQLAESEDAGAEEAEQVSDEQQVETTAEELEAFEKIKAIVSTSCNYHLEVKYKDVLSYFGVHVGNSTWWFLRLYLTPKRKSFVTRLPVDEVKSLVPDFEVQELSAPQGGAVSRVVISSVNDLDKLTSLILKCYETENAKH